MCGEDDDVRSDNDYNRSDYDFFGQVYDDDFMVSAGRRRGRIDPRRRPGHPGWCAVPWPASPG